MANLALLVLAVVVIAFIVYRLKYHGDGIVARRGMSIGADLGTMGDRARVRVVSVTKTGAERVHVLLSAATGGGEDPALVAAADLDFIVSMSDDDFGFQLLNKWQQDGSSLAVVIPPGSRLVRLRSVEDLQHLTLSRIMEAG